MLSRLTLRQKLIMVLAIPMLVLVVLAVLRINTAVSERSVAADQQSEVDRTVALFQLTNAVRAERDIVLLRGGTDQDLAVRRNNVDSTLARLSVPEAGYSPEVQQGLNELAVALAGERSVIGDSMDRIRLDTAMSSQSADVFDDLATSTLALVDFNEELVIDPETSQELATLQLAVEFNESLSREALMYYRTSTLSRPEQTSRVLRDAADRGQRSTQLEETLDQLATDEAAARFAALTSGDEYLQFLELRGTMAEAAVRNRAIDPLQVEVLSLFGLRPELESYQGELLSNVLRDASESRSAAQSALWRTIGLAGLLGLAVSILTFGLYRSIRRPLRRLTDSANSIAEEELPAVVAMMRSTETADDSAFEVTPLEADSHDEIGQLVDSFNKLHVTAVELASEQAQSRRTASDMFANLGRRNQRLLTQVLDEMDVLERDEQNAERLEKLFSIDQKITRMRRNAESLVVLAGQHTPRRWSEPAPVADVIRAAMSEVENFHRVTVRPGDEILIKGAVVADLTHLLAELLENALRFSPPTSPVEIGAHQLANNEAIIVIIDKGVGIDADQRERFNELIAAAATSEETPSKRLGHYVVGRLGGRHGITVELREDPVSRGTVARVVLGPAVAGEADFARGNAAELATRQAAPAELVEPAEVPSEAVAEESTVAQVEPAELAPVMAAVQPEVAAPTMAEVDVAAAPAASNAPRVPGANFETDAAPRSTAPATMDPRQAQRFEMQRNLDRRPLSAPGAFVGNTSGRGAASRGGAADSANPAPRVPGANLPEQLRQPRTTSESVPEAAESGSYWESFASFQDSSPTTQKDNS